jgi:hypothetical protein
MPVIEHYPVPHQAVEFAVAATLVDGAVSTIQVTLRSVGVLADPLLFVTDNSLEQEILSKGGYDEELDVDWANGTLDSTTTQGDYTIYVLTYNVLGSGC